jgi:ribosome-binding protein aMBF1 (putative translation factor)
MARNRRYASESLEYLHRRYVGEDPERRAAFEAALADAEVAGDIHRLRTEAGLTQAQLARKVGTATSVISRLEDAEYTGHSLSMLRRVAAALGRRVEVRFPPAPAPTPSGPGREPAAKRPRRARPKVEK